MLKSVIKGTTLQIITRAQITIYRILTNEGLRVRRVDEVKI